MIQKNSLLFRTQSAIFLKLFVFFCFCAQTVTAQKVGVNTSTPTATLDVNGTTKTDSLQLTIGAANGYVLRSDSSGNATWVSPTSLANGNWTTSGSNQFSALSGNVGIGTNTPSDKFHVVGNAIIDAGRLKFANNGESVFVGEYAGANDNLDHNYNVFVGYEAGKISSTGKANVAVGYQTLSNAADSYGNVAIGSSAGHSITTGQSNTAVGFYALYKHTTGYGNVSLGAYASMSNVSGIANTVIGWSAGLHSTGSGNIFMGYNCGFSETGSNKLYIENSSSSSPLIWGDFENDYLTVNGKLGIGTNSFNTESNLILAGLSSSEGGQLQLNSSTSGSTAWFLDNYQNAFRLLSGTNSGSSALRLFVGSTGNVGIGTGAPAEKLHVAGNLRVDGGKLQFTNTESSLYVGESAGNADSFSDGIDQENLAIGKEALNSSTAGFQNIAIGLRSLKNTVDGEGNIAIGVDALATATNVGNSVAVGNNALQFSLDGHQNVAIGNNALQETTTGAYNTAVGDDAGSDNQTGTDNTYIGVICGKHNTGSRNTMIGAGAGLNCTGYDNVLIGYETGENETGSNKLYIDNSNTASPLIWGDFSSNYLNFNANVGIGTTTPTQAKLVVNGSATNTLSYGYLTSSASIGTCSNCTATYSIYANQRIAASEFNAFSDRRIKKNLRRTDNAADLVKLMQLQITDYQMVDSIAKGNKVYKKVIAQELAEVLPSAVSTMKDVVPDIYQLSTMERGFVFLGKSGLKTGDRVRLIFGDNQEMATVQSVSLSGFQTDLTDNGPVFVYGREVDDFHTVDYEALTTLNISATQALVRQVAGLEKENDEMRSLLNALSVRLEALEANQPKPRLTSNDQ